MSYMQCPLCAGVQKRNKIIKAYLGSRPLHADINFFRTTGGQFSKLYKMDMRAKAQEFEHNLMLIDAQTFSVDYTHQVPRKLARVEGKQVFGALFSAVNENSQVRVCLLTHSTGQEELRPALQRMCDTFKALGYKGVEGAWTDNSAKDGRFLAQELPWRQGLDPLPQQQNFSHLPRLILPRSADVCGITKLLW